MDANGLRFWMLSRRDNWLPPWRANTAYILGQGVVDPNGNLQVVADVGEDSRSGGVQPLWPAAEGGMITDGSLTWTCQGQSQSQSGLFYCSKSQRLQLRSARTGSRQAEDFSHASSRVEVPPMARDQFGSYARWDPSSGQVMAGGSGATGAPPPDEISIYTPSPPAQVTDLVLGYDGVLYAAVAGSLVLIDRRNRWPNYALSAPDFHFWRLAALPSGGVLALDRSKPQLAKVAGLPLQTGPVDQPSPGILRSCEQNPNPPRIVSRFPLPSSEFFVALAAMDAGQFALLSWETNATDNETAYLRAFTEAAGVGTPIKLAEASFPYSLAWLGERKIAALVTNLKEALIFDLEDAGNMSVPAGETYTLADVNAGPFAHGFDLPPYYAHGARLVPLVPLSLNSFAGSAATDSACPAVIDSGSSQTVWHRLFLEAVIPPNCGALVWLSASDTLSGLLNPTSTWYPHVFGTPDLSAIRAEVLPDLPRAIWQSLSSEVVFAPAMLGQDTIKNRQGLFMVLIQRAHTAVRSLRGRFLGVRIQLNGDRRTTPEVAALRAYASRFSYVEHYLPELYREDTFGPEAEQTGASTRPDFLERFVDLFESQFTRIEDRIAKAYLLTRPESSPDDSLDWLGGWIGIDPSDYPPDRRRARLLAAPDLYRQRGTTQGITQALDVATNGLCSRGAIIVVEDFRLRHIFATILGADLSIKDDPLLPGYSPASNSMVGDTLFLGDPSLQADLQALFAHDLGLAGGAAPAQALYDELAHRMTVFIHDQVDKVDMGLVQRIVEAEKPAHVLASIQRASQPFMIGLASLLGVNTYLGPEPPRGTATLDSSQIGRYDVVQHLPSLDPRMESGQSSNTVLGP